MKIKTQAISITEETYPIAVACLPAGFAEIPLGNVVDCFLVINELGTITHNDEYHQSVGTGLNNAWYTQTEFLKKYDVVNKKPGVMARNAWYEVTLAFDEELHKQLNGTEEDESIHRTARRVNRFRRHVAGHGG